MKYGLIVFLTIMIIPSLYGSTSEQDKLVAAIGVSNLRKATSLYRKYCAARPNMQERKELSSFLALTAADVVQDRKESISLGIDRRDIIAMRTPDKFRDQFLLGVGTALMLSGFYSFTKAYKEYNGPVLSSQSDRYANLTLMIGYGTVGTILGAFFAYSGYNCVMQKRALAAAEKIREFFEKEALPKQPA